MVPVSGRGEDAGYERGPVGLVGGVGDAVDEDVPTTGVERDVEWRPVDGHVDLAEAVGLEDGDHGACGAALAAVENVMVSLAGGLCGQDITLGTVTLP